MLLRQLKLQNLVLFSTVALCLSLPGQAQIGSGAEVSAFGGIGLNLPSIGSIGTASPRVVAGGSFGFGFTPNLQAFFEPSFTGIGTTPHLLTFDGGAKFGLPTNGRNLTPFIDGVIGYSRYDYASAYSTPSDIIGANEGKMTFGAGGGLRWLIGERWGLEPEVRWQRDRITQNSLVYLRVGVFRHFGGR
jgi:hypothetical protein